MNRFPPCPICPANLAPLLMECDAFRSSSKAECRAIERHAVSHRTNPMFPPLGDPAHWFLGGGLVHGFFIEDGRNALSRSLRSAPTNSSTNSVKRDTSHEHRFRRRAVRSIGRRQAAQCREPNIVPHAGKLWALGGRSHHRSE